MRKDAKRLKEVKETLSNIWPSDNEFKSAFKEKTLTTPRIIKYLFAKLETAASKDASLIPNPESLTVEHILPRRPSPKWPTRVRSDEFLKQHLTKVGNLTILTEPMNQECESREFAFKQTLYKDSKFKITTELCSVSDWTEKEIEDRQAWLADIAATIWQM